MIDCRSRGRRLPRHRSHSTQTFPTIADATAYYETRTARGDDPGAPALLALCLGDEARAEALYRATAFRNRWSADLAYVQGHYLVYLRRRERLFALAGSTLPDLALPPATNDPWADLRALSRILEGAPDRAAPSYLLGHVYLAMDYHESAEAAYRRAIALDPRHPIRDENDHVLDPLLIDLCEPADHGIDYPPPSV